MLYLVTIVALLMLIALCYYNHLEAFKESERLENDRKRREAAGQD